MVIPRRPRSRFGVAALLTLLLVSTTATAGDRARRKPAVEPSSVYAAFVLAEVADAVGLDRRPVIFRASVDAARAVFIDGREAIVYNPDFLVEVNERAGTPWAAVSVIAHEIGHHYYGHSRERIDELPSGVLRQRELDADYFSGFALARMGASIEDAEAAQQALFDEHETPTHPSSASRLDAITEGWLDGRDDDAAAPGALQARRTPARVSPRIALDLAPAQAFPDGSW